MRADLITGCVEEVDVIVVTTQNWIKREKWERCYKNVDWDFPVDY